MRTVAREHSADVDRALEAYLGGAGLDDVEQVTREELLARLADDSVLLLDVRPVEEFAAGHIPGARSVPFGDLTSDQAAGTCSPTPVRRRWSPTAAGPGACWPTTRSGCCARGAPTCGALEDGMLEWRTTGHPVEVALMGPLDAHRRARGGGRAAGDGLGFVLVVAVPTDLIDTPLFSARDPADVVGVALPRGLLGARWSDHRHLRAAAAGRRAVGSARRTRGSYAAGPADLLRGRVPGLQQAGPAGARRGRCRDVVRALPTVPAAARRGLCWPGHSPAGSAPARAVPFRPRHTEKQWRPCDDRSTRRTPAPTRDRRSATLPWVVAAVAALWRWRPSWCPRVSGDATEGSDAAATSGDVGRPGVRRPRRVRASYARATRRRWGRWTRRW